MPAKPGLPPCRTANSTTAPRTPHRISLLACSARNSADALGALHRQSLRRSFNVFHIRFSPLLASSLHCIQVWHSMDVVALLTIIKTPGDPGGIRTRDLLDENQIS